MKLFLAAASARLSPQRWRNCLHPGAAFLVVCLLGACSTIDTAAPPHVSRTDAWALLPMANYTETPMAGQRAASIAGGVLSAAGFTNLKRYPASMDDETLFDSGKPESAQKALDWARGQHARFALTGAVNEWRYKVGVDGEPAVGLTLQVIDVATGNVIWSGTGSRSGWSRDALSSVAQKLERQLLAPIAANSNIRNP